MIGHKNARYAAFGWAVAPPKKLGRRCGAMPEAVARRMPAGPKPPWRALRLYRVACAVQMIALAGVVVALSLRGRFRP